jgi:hypothetical protein
LLFYPANSISVFDVVQTNQRKSGFGASDELSSEEEEDDKEAKPPTSVAGPTPTTVLRNRHLHSFSNLSPPEVNPKTECLALCSLSERWTFSLTSPIICTGGK